MTRRILLLSITGFLFFTTMVVQAADPRVVLETSKGAITIELDPAKAPASVDNFLSYTEAGFYDGTIFHRVIPGFMIQGGGFDGALKRKPTRDPIKNESQNGLKNLRGSIAMARLNDPHSATAQFFINLANNDSLDHPNHGGYTVFGRVVEGMEVVDAIAAVKTGRKGAMGDVPVEAVTIVKAKVKKPAGG